MTKLCLTQGQIDGAVRMYRRYLNEMAVSDTVEVRTILAPGVPVATIILKGPGAFDAASELHAVLGDHLGLNTHITDREPATPDSPASGAN